jgi:hypothetical protein
MFSETDNKCMASNQGGVQKCLEMDLARQQRGQRSDFDKFLLVLDKTFRLKMAYKHLTVVMRKSLLTLVAIVAAGVLFSTSAYGVSWLDPAWSDRSSVTISNPGQSDLTDYEVQITLGSSFPFSSANSDGSDIRVTAADGVTLIPFWIETWTPGTQQGSLWIKVPEIPAVGTTVFLYYGNPSAVASPPVPVAGPPLGPFTKAQGNPIVPIGDPGAGQDLLAENIVYDSVTQHYWMVFSIYRDADPGVGLMWSDNPTDPTSWNWYGNVYTNPTPFVIGMSWAPCLVQYNGTWYLFFSDWSGPFDNPHSIVVSTATSVTGPYSTPTVVLSPAPGTWENWRVDEPYVFQRNDGMWIMMYMADSTTGDNPAAVEQVGYAYADNILGPYTKYAGNPVLAFGSPGSIDAGTIADPWVIQCPGQYCWQGTYYIGYSASPTSASPWQTAYATTTDWQTFTKHGMLLPDSSSGWDDDNSFRGAVLQVGDTYVLSYTGDFFEMGIATQPVVSTSADIINNPEAVFDFYDDFAGTALDSSKWAVTNGSASQAVEAGGTLTLTATSTSFVEITSVPTFGMNYIVEASAQHPQQGVLDMVAEVGLIDSDFGDIVRIVDDYPASTATWNRQAKLSGQADSNWNAMAEAADQQWHIFGVYRLSSNVAGFQIDQNPVESVTSNVPTSNLSAYLMSYTGGANNQVVADWIRVRKFVSPQPVAALDPANSIAISPLTASISTGGSQSYTAQAFDQYGNSMGFVTASTSFTISPDGSCTGASCTASVAGAHTVTGTYSGMTATASLQVGAGTTNNPVPATTSLSPSSAPAGGSAFTLTVNGNGFVNGSVVQWNGGSRATTYVSSTQVTAAITAADIASGGTAQVMVFSPAPGGGISNAQTFTINNPVPATTGLSPASVTAGGSGFTLTVNGNGFVNGSVVQWNGSNRTTTYVSSTQLTAAILAADIAIAGTAKVTVVNSAPSGGTSNAQTFTTNNPVPATTGLSPASATAGGSGFTLTVNGTGFVSGSTVSWKGSSRTTTYVSSTQVTAAVTAADIASGGTAAVTVVNATPGGGTSNAQTFTINNPVPTMTGLSPASATAGGAAFTLTVNGTGFVSGSTVNWKGSSRTTTYVSPTQVSAAITAADIASGGTAAVTVVNPTPGGGTSNAQTFTITGLALDSSTPAAVKTNTQTLTTASFTPPAGSVLYICVMLNSNASPATDQNYVSQITDNLSTHLTYTLQKQYGTASGSSAIVYLYTAPVSTSQAMKVSITQGASDSSISNAMVQVLVITGANASSPVGKTAGAGATATNISGTDYNSSVNDSWSWLIYADWNANAVPTVPSGETVYSSYTNTMLTAAVIKNNSVTATAGTSVTIKTSTPTSGVDLAWLAFEIIP